MTLLRKPLLLLFSFLTFCATSQDLDVEITGQVFLLNSMNKYGKIKYVRGAQIKTLQTKTTYSNKRGQFKLKFKNVNPDEQLFISVKKEGYEVIDEKDLQYFLIDKKKRLRVFLAEKGHVRKVRGALIASALKAHNTEKERLLDLLEFGGVAEKAAFKTIEERTGIKLYTPHDAKAFILKMSKEYLEHLSPMSYELAIVNPDFASDIYLSALDFYFQGDPEETVATLQEEDLDKSFKEIMSMINEVKDDPEQVREVVELRFRRLDQIKNNYIFQIVALQQFFKFKEANEVIKKLEKVNAVAPTHKHTKLIQALNYFQETAPAEPNENVVVEKPVENNATTKEKYEALTAPENIVLESFSKPIAINSKVTEQEENLIAKSDLVKPKESNLEPNIKLEKKEMPKSYDVLSDKGNIQNANEAITKVTQIETATSQKEVIKKDRSNKSLANASLDDFENILFFSNISAVELISILQDEQKEIAASNNKTSTTKIKREKLEKISTPVIVETTKSEPIVYTPPPPVVQNTSDYLVFSDIPEPSFYKILKKTSLRKSPDPKAKILKRLAVGTEMEFIEKIDKYWYKVRLNGKIGYVKSYRLRKVNY